MGENKNLSNIEPETPDGFTLESLGQDLGETLFYYIGKVPSMASAQNIYEALALTVRKRLLHRWINTVMDYTRQNVKVVCYFSAEYLPGPFLGNNLVNLGVFEIVKKAFEEGGSSLDRFLEQEEEPGLGNGGLGRLAACFLDSLATLEIPSIGYGLRYEFGIFNQEIRDGWQVERTDKWLQWDNPWEIHRSEISYEVKLGGQTEVYTDIQGRMAVRWIPERVVKGVAYDTPIQGYQVNTCNLLRLWKAEAVESFNFQAFNQGDYYDAVEEKLVSENLTKVLYPNDEGLEGKRLRLEQQYFFCSCALQDMIRLHLHVKPDDLDDFHQDWVVQLNDTHPAVSVAELMRLLVDEHQLSWDQAWSITQQVFCYTNHTLLPEALEKWPVALFASVLPRHLEIIFEINHRFLDEVRLQFPGDEVRVAQFSLIDETGERYVRMAHLASVGSRAINGVAALHTELLKSTILKDFYELWPGKFHNITNGVTPRRFLVLSNPRLASLISSKIGTTWIKNLKELRRLEAYAQDPAFHRAWEEVKQANKQALATMIQERTGVKVDPHSMFDIQVKRLHEYKRQHLNVLHIITLYNRLKKDPHLETTPRTFIFGGKAAPGYYMAKLIIKLINSVAEMINRDHDTSDRLKVVFFPNLNVKNGQKIYPAADLSEQISTAGKEASGTGNMKFSLNGALTIGTLDGANVEIREEVGPENFFLFGRTLADVHNLRAQGYDPRYEYATNEHLKECIDLIGSGFFSHGDRELFRPLLDSLLNFDEYLVLADYQSYIEKQDEVGLVFQDKARWTRMSILNTARMGKFSSDRSIQEYCDNIWQVQPRAVDLEEISLEQVRFNV